MSDLNNIDELLKDSFSHFEATPPPGAWGAIQQGIPASVPGGTEATVKTAATVVKSTSIITKIVLAVAVPAALAGGYLAYTYMGKSPDAKTSTSAEQAAVTMHAAPEVVTAPDMPAAAQTNTATTAAATESSLHLRSGVQAGKPSAAPAEKGTTGAQHLPAQQLTPGTTQPENMQPQPEAVTNTDVKPSETPARQQPSVITPTRPQPKVKRNYFEQAEEHAAKSSDNEQAYEKPFIPNVITPNNDGENDRFVILVNDEVLYQLRIIDKNGNVVFESSSKDKTWDGTLQNSGQLCDDGTYLYDFSYQHKHAASAKRMSGRIVLTR